MVNTKIDWCDSSWNPVTGCLHGCGYCYARGIVNRFGGKSLNIPHVLDDPFLRNGKKQPYPFGFTPTFHKYKLGEYKEKKGRNIFVCSMADLFGAWVPIEWIKEVLDACKAAPQHNYLFLTKNPQRYIELAKNGILIPDDNFWYGSSVTGPHDMYSWFDKDYNWFLSVEPIHEDLGEMDPNAAKPGWIIVGAETGNRKGKVNPERGWIENILQECRKYNIPMFMKSSLAGIWAEPIIQEYPEKLKKGKGLENA